MRNRRAWLILAVAIVFTAVLTYPYLGLHIEDSRLDVRGEAHYAVLVAHVFTAAVALVLGPLQFLPRLRGRERRAGLVDDPGRPDARLDRQPRRGGGRDQAPQRQVRPPASRPGHQQ